ncbi:chromosome alignment-maintaining phosphoprotein 1 [Aquarana catesbeiana]|uniref:chromosome alignment-maintaining phosphoprotein 1 n=1 Tax=Aquarana catesbeiana TaxID=8400 RepID=UPI003CC96218
MEILENQLDCTRCSFHGSDFKSTQIHMGTIHPEFCEEIDTGGLGKLVFYQKSARLFHCHRCFFTSKLFANVYYHILSQHAVPDKWRKETKPIVEPKSEPASEVDSEKNDSESLESEDDKYVDEQDQSKTNEAVKSEENDTLTSWPEKAPTQDYPDNSDSDFKSNSIEKVSEMSAETKDKESFSEPDLLESESSNTSSSLKKTSSVRAKVGIEFSDDAASSLSKDIPEFSDDDDEPALPGGIPHFSEDEETAPQAKEAESSSEDDLIPDQSRGIEDISEDEMPPEEKPTDNMSEDEAAPVPSKDLQNSSEEEENASATGKEMDFSEDNEEDAPAPSKEIMDFSEEDDEESTIIPKNAMDFSDEEETANAAKNIMEFSEGEETTNVSKHVMEFSEEGTSGLSKDIMEFSEEDDTPAISKGIMEFSDEDEAYSPSKDMPKYLEGNTTPTQLKDSEYTDDAPTSVVKGSSPFSEDEQIPDEGTPSEPKDFAGTSANINIPARLPGVAHFSEYKATPWSKDRLETINTTDISLTVHETIDASDDKDGFGKDEEILKHVKRVKGRFHCLLCDCRPLKRGPILHHLITRHNMPSPFICKTCGKTFVMETHLKNHLASHTKGLYKCHRCNFQTDHPRGFKKHQTHCDNRHKEEAIKPVDDVKAVDEVKAVDAIAPLDAITPLDDITPLDAITAADAIKPLDFNDIHEDDNEED